MCDVIRDLGICFTTTGIMSDLVPFAADQEIDMKINGDTMSGVAEEYVSVRACSQLTNPQHL